MRTRLRHVSAAAASYRFALPRSRRSDRRDTRGAAPRARDRRRSRAAARPASHAPEARRPLLEERRHAFLEVGPREALHHQLDRLLLRRTELARELLVDLALH